MHKLLLLHIIGNRTHNITYTLYRYLSTYFDMSKNGREMLRNVDGACVCVGGGGGDLYILALSKQ